MTAIPRDTNPGNKVAQQLLGKMKEAAKSFWPDTKETLRYTFNYDMDQIALSKSLEKLTGNKTARIVDYTVEDPKNKTPVPTTGEIKGG